jgi:hypothetical protein
MAGLDRRGCYHYVVPRNKEALMVQVLGVEVQPTEVKEPVMDIPAIDMTDAVVPARKAPAPVRKSAKRAASSRKQSARSAKAKAQPKRTRDGSVGRDTFEQVEALLKQGKNKSDAFKQIAEDTGQNSGTVAANYYRVARASGAVKLRKARAKAGPARTTRGRQRAAQSVRQPRSVRSGNDVAGVEQIVGQLVATVAALTEAVKAQDAEVRQLRGRLDGVRSLLG